MNDAGLSEAAKLALNSPAMIHAIALSAWIAESGPRPVTKRQVLRKQDVQAAAAAIGVTAPEKLRTAPTSQRWTGHGSSRWPPACSVSTATR